MDSVSLKSICISSFCLVGWALATSACSDKGATYVVYAGGAGGTVGSGASTSSGGSSSGGSSSGGSSSGGSSAGGSSAGGSSAGGGGQPQTGGSAGAPPGGSSSSGGAGAGGPGGSGNQSGSGNGGSGGVQTPVTLIDDFADCDGNIIEVDGRNGVWYNLNGSASNTMTVGQAPDGWTPGCGVYLVGNCPSCEVAGLAVILAAGTYDLSGYQGISVTFESEATLYVAVKTTNGSSYSYLRSSEVLGTGSGGTRMIYFASMTPDAGFHGLNWAQEIHFTIDDYSKEMGFGLGISRLELIP